jgi:hypothetical protein
MSPQRCGVARTRPRTLATETPANEVSISRVQAACDGPETRETRTASASGPLSPADFQICPPHAGQ